METKAKTDRVPPGQYLTEKWPVLHYGSVPRVDVQKWTFRVFGTVEDERTWTYEEFKALGHVKNRCDIHCVTTWSRLENDFEGVPFRAVLAQVKRRPGADWVLVHAEQGYTTNVPLVDLDRDDVLFAYKHDGKDLTPDHGWPLRLVVPHLYFWKSAKWVRGLEFITQDKAGFWENAGYHMYGDPWKEQRFRDDW